MLDGVGWRILAGFFAISALVLAVYQIICHLQTYTGPIYQRYIVRIIFMVPVYGVMSFLSFTLPQLSVYFNSVRDMYEAWVIYNFLSLCLAYVGGPGSVEVKMHGYMLTPSCLYCTCCLPPMPVNGAFVRTCKQGALQFVFLKPVLALVSIILYTQGAYVEGYWAPNSGYLWIAIIYNVTYSTALYALLLFYLGTHDMLSPFNPLIKFTVVKAVVFLTFWQGLFIAILSGAGVLKANEGKDLQNLIICVEMLPAAAGMLLAFPYTEYKGTGPSAGMGLENMRHVISIHDVVSDTMHQFAPTYHDYVLYSNGGTKEPPKKVRAKTFVAVGHETANRSGLPGGGGPAPQRESMNADLLSNAELGIHAPGAAMGATDAPGAGRKPSDPNALFPPDGPEADDDDGIELSSAPVAPNAASGKAKKGGVFGGGPLQRDATEDEEAAQRGRATDDYDDDFLSSTAAPAAAFAAAGGSREHKSVARLPGSQPVTPGKQQSPTKQPGIAAGILPSPSTRHSAKDWIDVDLK